MPPADPPSQLERDAGLWPESAQPRSSGFGSSMLSRFDPLGASRPRDAAHAQAQAATAFEVCHPALAWRAVLLVQAVLAVAALASAASPADWLARQAALAFGGAAATLVWLVTLCGARRALKRLSAPARSGVVLLLGAAAALAAWAPLWAVDLAGAADGLRPAGVAAAGALLAALLWAWLDLRARIWQPADASARLAELQSRIRPHFLFNALNTALALVRADPARAEQVLEDLAQLFRVALADAGASVPLAEEIALARAYLAIEEARYGPRIRVEWDLDPAAGHARVPPLVLQPLVENAVRHGIEPSREGGFVHIATRVQLGRAVVTVRNSVGLRGSEPGHGMALANVRERLALLHDLEAQVDLQREAGEFVARITLPLD